MHKTEVRVPENVQNDVEKRERGSYVHARKNESDIVKKVMSKLFVGILLASVLIGILAVVPEKVRAEKPDMVVDDIWIEPASFAPGDKVAVCWKACNIGTGDATGRNVAQAYLDTDPAGGRVAPDPLKPGDCFEFRATKTWPSDYGTHDVKVVVDRDEGVAESNEGNNERIESFSAVPAVSPNVTTSDASDITTHSATLNGKLDALGSASSVKVFFEWGLNTGYGYQTTPQTISSSRAFSFDLGGLSPNTAYHFRAKAVGDGTSYGSDKSFTTTVTMPSAPRNLEAAGGDSYVDLSWTPPSVDGGAAITNYMIYRGTTSGGETLLTKVGNVLTHNDSDVINNRTYYYQVSAVNASGEGEKSEGVEVTLTSDVTTPSTPRDLRATAGDRYVNLNWNAPGDDGGAAITNYKIYRGATSGEETLLTTVGNVSTYSDSAVTSDQNYYYQVSAVNAAGEGEKSEEAEVIPTSVPPTLTLAVTTPSAPRNLQTNAGDRYVKLDWNTPSDDGGSPVTGYKVYRGTAPGEETLLTTVGNVLSYNDAPVTSGQKYYYQVSAVNSAGEGAKSNEKIVIVLGTGGDVNMPIIAAIITALAIIAAAIINYLPPRKSKERGSISATSSPDGARVFIEGVDKGESPVTLGKIRKGTRIVLFSKSGYSDCEKRVVVNADQITSVHCDLKNRR